MRNTHAALWRLWLVSNREETSDGSHRLQPSPPSRMRAHTFRLGGSSHCSMLPPSVCGPSVNALGPGARMRKRSKYEIGVRIETEVEEEGSEACQRERRYFWIYIRMFVSLHINQEYKTLAFLT